MLAANDGLDNRAGVQVVAGALDYGRVGAVAGSRRQELGTWRSDPECVQTGTTPGQEVALHPGPSWASLCC